MTTKPEMESQNSKSGKIKITTKNGKAEKSFPIFSWEALDKKRNHWAILLVLSVIISMFLTPGLSTTTESYDDTWVGQISTTDIRSPGNYNVQDLQATESKKDEAARAILPIYDFNSNLGNEVQARIKKAFVEMQSLIIDFIVLNVLMPEEHKLLQEQKDKNSNKKQLKQTKEVKTTSTKTNLSKEMYRKKVVNNMEHYFNVVTSDEDLNQQLMATVFSARNTFIKNIQSVIPEADYLKLYHYHFSTELMNALILVIGDVFSHKIINDKELMEKGENGDITIKIVDHASTSHNEYVRKDLSSILDFKEVNQSLWRYTNSLSTLGKKQRDFLLSLGSTLLQPNLSYNRKLTIERQKEASDNIKTMFIPIKKGEMIIRDGERFEKRHLTILRGIENTISSTNPLIVLTGYTLFFFVFIMTLFVFGSNNIRKFQLTIKDMTMMAFLTVLFIVMVKTTALVANAFDSVFDNVAPHIYYIAVPVAAGAAMVRIVLNSEVAIVFGLFIALLFSILTTSPFFIAVYSVVCGLIAADAVGQCRARTTLVFAGLRVSLAAMLIVLFYHLFTGTILSSDFVYSIFAATTSGVLTAIALSGMTPIIEFLFNYTTDIKLLELANLNHPLLKKLIVQAPGTYHHSIVIGSLVEAAAESIHANPLVARVAAYYHDIGKVKTPLYFGENQHEGKNPHDDLTPNMSVLILLSHVKEGVDLANKYNLGKTITSIIEQHHGTSLIRFFHNKAMEMKQNGENISDDETEFRYPGPKPQTREAGLVMLADAVEASTRSLSEPTPERLQGQVQKIINMIFRDGQLNECELTLKDLHEIARSFTKILVGMHHSRPAYPEKKRTQEMNNNGRSNTKQTKKDKDRNEEMEDGDDKNIKRLGMQK